MRFKIFSLVTFLIFAFVTSGNLVMAAQCLGQTQTKECPATCKSSCKAQPSCTCKTPCATPCATPCVCSEEILIICAEEPEKSFKKANESFSKKDMKAVASDLRKGAEFLKKTAGCVTEDAKKALLSTAQDIEKLAKDIEKGTIKSDKDLKKAFAKIHYDFARYSQQKAKESWLKKDARKVGHYLKAVVIHTEYAARWSGYELEAGTIALVNGVRNVSSKLIKGTGWAATEVGKAIEDSGKVVEKVGAKLEPKTK